MKNDITRYLIKLYNVKTHLTTEHELITIEGSHPANHNILWDVQFDFFGKKLEIKSEYLLSSAIDKIREIVEPQYYRMLIAWSELSAVQSGMLGDMSAGIFTYKVERGNSKYEYSYKSSKDNKITFHVLEESSFKYIGSLEEQKQFRKQFCNSAREKFNVGPIKENVSITSWVKKIFKI